MYRALYDQMTEEAAAAVRSNEYRAFSRCLDLLEEAERAERGSRQSVEALLFASKLWTLLLEDLASDGNSLPDQLRASLISIGIWALRQAEDIRQGRVESFAALIDVTRTIRGGLEKT